MRLYGFTPYRPASSVKPCTARTLSARAERIASRAVVGRMSLCAFLARARFSHAAATSVDIATASSGAIRIPVIGTTRKRETRERGK